MSESLTSENLFQLYYLSALGALRKRHNFECLLSFSQNIFLGLTRVYALLNCEPVGYCCEADVEPRICIQTSYGKQMEIHGGRYDKQSHVIEVA